MNVIFGSGSWGTTLAIVLARQKEPVTLLTRGPDEVEALRSAGENSRFLPGIRFPDGLRISHDKAVLQDAQTLILAVPSAAMGAAVEGLAPHIARSCLIVSGSKGLAPGSRRLTELIAERLPNPVCALSGPNLASEVARELPATSVVASHHESAAAHVQRLFVNSNFRVYTSRDVVGVELAGALKNVVALAAGAADGMRLGDNAKAALITRGLVEMGRLGRALDAEPFTFAGLAGMGDLVATCASPFSRNRRLGEALGRGRSLAEAQLEVGQVAEGVPTTRAAVQLARKSGVEMPIAEQMHEVLFGGKDPRKAVLDLMQREPKAE